jgi:hypothetical protein
MSYVPPHLRKSVKDDWIVQGKKKEKQNQIKEKVDEFPALVPILPVQKSKMDFSTGFWDFTDNTIGIQFRTNKPATDSFVPMWQTNAGG